MISGVSDDKNSEYIGVFATVWETILRCRSMAQGRWFEEKWEYNILWDCPFKFKIMSTRFPPEFPMILVKSWNIIVRYEILFLPTLGTSSFTWNISRNCWIHKIFPFYQIRDCIIREIIHPYILGISRDSSELKDISVIMYKIIHIIFYPRNIPSCSWLLNYIFPVIYSIFPLRWAFFAVGNAGMLHYHLLYHISFCTYWI